MKFQFFFRRHLDLTRKSKFNQNKPHFFPLLYFHFYIRCSIAFTYRYSLLKNHTLFIFSKNFPFIHYLTWRETFHFRLIIGDNFSPLSFFLITISFLSTSLIFVNRKNKGGKIKKRKETFVEFIKKSRISHYYWRWWFFVVVLLAAH
jgi:hypothetical protein